MSSQYVYKLYMTSSKRYTSNIHTAKLTSAVSMATVELIRVYQILVGRPLKCDQLVIPYNYVLQCYVISFAFKIVPCMNLYHFKGKFDLQK